MTTFKNARFIKRDYECTNVVACVAESAPSADWVACDESVLRGLTRLHTIAGVVYYGHM